MRYLIAALLFTAITILTGCSVTRYMESADNLVKQINSQKGLIAFWDFVDTSGHPAAGIAKEVRLNPYGSARFVKGSPFSGWAIELDGKSYWSIGHENSCRIYHKAIGRKRFVKEI